MNDQGLPCKRAFCVAQFRCCCAPCVHGLLQRLRLKTSMPVIFLTSKDDEIDEVLGLRMGADDYVKKPFSQRLLVERIRALLRRQEIGFVTQFLNALLKDLPYEYTIEDKTILINKVTQPPCTNLAMLPTKKASSIAM